MTESAEVIKMSVTMTRRIQIEPSVARALHKKRVAGRAPLAPFLFFAERPSGFFNPPFGFVAVSVSRLHVESVLYF